MFGFCQQSLSTTPGVPPGVTWLPQLKENGNSILWLEVTGDIKVLHCQRQPFKQNLYAVQNVNSAQCKRKEKEKRKTLLAYNSKENNAEIIRQKQEGRQLHTIILSNKKNIYGITILS